MYVLRQYVSEILEDIQKHLYDEYTRQNPKRFLEAADASIAAADSLITKGYHATHLVVGGMLAKAGEALEAAGKFDIAARVYVVASYGTEPQDEWKGLMNAAVAYRRADMLDDAEDRYFLAWKLFHTKARNGSLDLGTADAKKLISNLIFMYSVGERKARLGTSRREKMLVALAPLLFVAGFTPDPPSPSSAEESVHDIILKHGRQRSEEYLKKIYTQKVAAKKARVPKNI